MLLVNAPGPLVVEVAESVKPYPCPICTAVSKRGQARDGCGYCGSSGTIGAGLPDVGVAIDDLDRARFWQRGQRPVSGEGIHALHECAGQQAA